MAYLHSLIGIPILNPIRTSNQMATLYYVEHVHIAHTLTRISTLFLYRTGIRVRIRIRVRLLQCK